ncbi:hypothetical protein [Singulisphaera sp. GP187]|uniref:hypothetical protein n=1 Tax=Singulisphaera sp. GP187 TaxID=1882752 RepID=UPI001160EC75|nr:hypothetical protein [Singulisphaera sp. GP187]
MDDNHRLEAIGSALPTVSIVEESKIRREYRDDKRDEDDGEKPECHHQATIALAKIGTEEGVDTFSLFNATDHDISKQKADDDERADDCTAGQDRNFRGRGEFGRPAVRVFQNHPQGKGHANERSAEQLEDDRFVGSEKVFELSLERNLCHC